MRHWILLCLFSVLAASAVADAGEPEQQFAAIGDFELVSGEVLQHTAIGYITAGTLKADRSNVVVFPSWFGGSAADLFQVGKIGPGKLVDTDKYYVVAVDSLGNGISTSPSNSVRQSGEAFPAITIADMVNASHRLLSDFLDFDRAYAVVGISMGGIQALQWAGQHPQFMDKVVAVDATPKLSSYDLALWNSYVDAINTMQAAGVADEAIMQLIGSFEMLALWTPEYLVENVPLEGFPQFREQMQMGRMTTDPNDYKAQLHAILGHDVYAGPAAADNSYGNTVQAELLLVGTPSDQMVYQSPARELAGSLGALYVSIESNCGHLGTSCEEQRVSAIVNSFLAPAAEQE